MRIEVWFRANLTYKTSYLCYSYVALDDALQKKSSQETYDRVLDLHVAGKCYKVILKKFRYQSVHS